MGQLYLMKLNIQKFAGNGCAVSVSETTDIATNTSTFTITATVTTNSTTYNQTASGAYVQGSYSGGASGSLSKQSFKIAKSSSVTKTWTISGIPHNSDGTLGQITFSVYWYLTSSTSGTTTKSIQPATIPRYATITQYDVYAVDETTLGVNWNADAACDAVSYSIDGSNWISTGGLTFYVGGLSAGTWHTISIAIKRADSQLWTYSYDTYEVKGAWTYSYPYVEYVTDFVIGSGNCNANLINPLGRQVTLDLISNNDGSIIGTYSGTYNGLVGAEFNTAEAIDKQYRSIPNNPSGTYYARVTYGQVVNTSSSKTYYVNTADCKPTFNLFTWEDVNATTLALTGDSSIVVKDQSNIEVTIPVANKASAKNYATITKYEFKCGNKSNDNIAYSSSEDVSGTIIGVPDSTFQVRAVDSRRLPSDWVTLVAQNFIQYNNLIKGNASISRIGEVSSQTTITFNGKVSLVNFGQTTNSITNVTYQYKKSSDSSYTTGTTTITPTIDQNGNFSFSGLILGDVLDGFDVQNVYTILINVFDEISNPYITFELTLGSGRPHLAWHKNGLSVMGKYNETAGGKLQIAGVNIFDLIYPVGSIYISTNNTSPATLFGVGTWERMSGGFLYGTSGNSASTGNGTGTSTGEYTGNTGSHAITWNEMPSHTHDRGTMEISGSFRTRPMTNDSNVAEAAGGAFGWTADGGGASWWQGLNYTSLSSALPTDLIDFYASRNWTGNTGSAGANWGHDHGMTHNHAIPYMKVIIWKRTA